MRKFQLFYLNQLKALLLKMDIIKDGGNSEYEMANFTLLGSRLESAGRLMDVDMSDIEVVLEENEGVCGTST